MVRPRRNRPVRRNLHAGPSRSRRPAPPLPDATQPLDEDRFPNLAALRRGERQQMVRAARRAGLTRTQASQHADEHLMHSGE